MHELTIFDALKLPAECLCVLEVEGGTLKLLASPVVGTGGYFLLARVLLAQPRIVHSALFACNSSDSGPPHPAILSDCRSDVL